MALACLCFGALFLGFGLFKYGFWMDRGPGAGFFPAVFGAGTVLLAAFELMRPGQIKGRVQLRNHAPIIAILAAILCIPLVGMIPAMALFVLGWLKLVEGAPWLRSLLVAAATALLTTLIFDVWLRVQFPPSLLEKLL
ncbi:tripartite tricarboxylate transporter TctB family protein [Oceanicola sp. 502str15]|uniref:tripartite tricarboxylate transporter TctB family protein n=1 Tax=Oceanicola sp. 502str15 TaxID=2696061 RepID=UPI00209408DA|nr:tripartite tricarboxylate transporter TctB family protein [Oceanicola sp. 502str15]